MFHMNVIVLVRHEYKNYRKSLELISKKTKITKNLVKFRTLQLTGWGN